MITFKQFLSEEKIEDSKEMLKQKCDKFLNAFPDTKLYRGMNISNNEPVIEMTVRLDRKPLSSSKIYHEQLDNYLKEKFGHSFRSAAIFATQSKVLANTYGEAYEIYPEKDYTFCYSEKVPDAYLIGAGIGSLGYEEVQSAFDKYHLNIDYRQLLKKYHLDNKLYFSMKNMKDIKAFSTELFDSFDYKLSKDTLPSNKECEIMIQCEKYIAIKVQQ